VVGRAMTWGKVAESRRPATRLTLADMNFMMLECSGSFR